MSKLDKAMSVMLWGNVVWFGISCVHLVFHCHNYAAAVYCSLAGIWLCAFILLQNSKRNTDRLLDEAITEWRGCIDAIVQTNHSHAALVRRCAGLVQALKRAAVKKREYARMKVLADKYLREGSVKCQYVAHKINGKEFV